MSWTQIFSPMPSMSIAPREAKWKIRCTRWAGHSRLTQYRSASPSRRTSSWPQTGQSLGNRQGTASAGRSDSTGATTSGMTSPALRTTTVSPSRTSLRATSSSLWRVARATVEPPTKTGVSEAKGVARPVRPMLTKIRSRTVVFSSGGNLKAMAQRGALLVKPMRRRWSRSSTLMTAPSIS